MDERAARHRTSAAELHTVASSARTGTAADGTCCPAPRELAAAHARAVHIHRREERCVQGTRLTMRRSGDPDAAAAKDAEAAAGATRSPIGHRALGGAGGADDTLGNQRRSGANHRDSVSRMGDGSPSRLPETVKHWVS